MSNALFNGQFFIQYLTGMPIQHSLFISNGYSSHLNESQVSQKFKMTFYEWIPKPFYVVYFHHFCPVKFRGSVTHSVTKSCAKWKTLFSWEIVFHQFFTFLFHSLALRMNSSTFAVVYQYGYIIHLYFYAMYNHKL